MGGAIQQVSQLQTENSSLHNRTGILQKILDMRNEQIQVMQEAKEGSSDRLSAALPESEAGGKLIKLTPEVIKDLTPEQMQVIYQTYVRELSARIGQLRKQDPPDAAGLQDLEELTRDLSMVLFRFTMEKPLDLRKFVVNSRQFLASTEEEVIALWRKMLEQIPPLNDDQKRAIVSQRQAFYRNIEPVMEERRKLNAQIQGELPADTFHTRSALTYIKAHEAVIKLRENLKQEHLVTFDFAQKVLRQTFTLMQVACLLVASFPVVPDALGISSAVAAELGVLHAASSSGGAAAPAGSSAAGGGGAAGGGSGAPGLPHHLHGVVPGVYAMPMNGLMQGGGAGGSGLGLLPSDGTGGLGQTQLQPH